MVGCCGDFTTICLAFSSPPSSLPSAVKSVHETRFYVNRSYPLLLTLTVCSTCLCQSRYFMNRSRRIGHTRSNLSKESCHHHFSLGISKICRRLPDKDRSTRCMLCCIETVIRHDFFRWWREGRLTYLLYFAPPFSQAFLFSSS